MKTRSMGVGEERSEDLGKDGDRRAGLGRGRGGKRGGKRAGEG